MKGHLKHETHCAFGFDTHCLPWTEKHQPPPQDGKSSIPKQLQGFMEMDD